MRLLRLTQRVAVLAGAASMVTAIQLPTAGRAAGATTLSCIGPTSAAGTNLVTAHYDTPVNGTFTLEVNGPVHRIVQMTVQRLNGTTSYPVDMKLTGLPHGSYYGNISGPAGCTSIYNRLFNVSGK